MATLTPSDSIIWSVSDGNKLMSDILVQFSRRLKSFAVNLENIKHEMHCNLIAGKCLIHEKNLQLEKTNLYFPIIFNQQQKSPTVCLGQMKFPWSYAHHKKLLFTWISSFLVKDFDKNRRSNFKTSRKLEEYWYTGAMLWFRTLSKRFPILNLHKN